MHIDPSSVIEGIPSTKVRDLLRWLDDGFMDLRQAADRMKVPIQTAEAIVSELASRGFVEKVEEGWALTAEGGRFALAKAHRQLTRPTAKRLVNALIARVEEVNQDSQYVYRVQRLVVFGSFLTKAPRLTDIDVAVTLSPRDPDTSRLGPRRRERSDSVARAGRRFKDHYEYLCWPELEIYMTLKAGSRYISLHTERDPALETGAYQVLYEYR